MSYRHLQQLWPLLYRAETKLKPSALGPPTPGSEMRTVRRSRRLALCCSALVACCCFCSSARRAAACTSKRTHVWAHNASSLRVCAPHVHHASTSPKNPTFSCILNTGSYASTTSAPCADMLCFWWCSDAAQVLLLINNQLGFKDLHLRAYFHSTSENVTRRRVPCSKVAYATHVHNTSTSSQCWAWKAQQRLA